jgi:hypothetical protein
LTAAAMFTSLDIAMQPGDPRSERFENPNRFPILWFLTIF